MFFLLNFFITKKNKYSVKCNGNVVSTNKTFNQILFV